MSSEDNAMADTEQGRFGKVGYVNYNSGTWHYLKRCAGGRYGSDKMSLSEAIDTGHSLCGNCASRFQWYANTQ